MLDLLLIIALISTLFTIYLSLIISIIICQVFFSIPFFTYFRDNYKTKKLLLEASRFYSEQLDMEKDIVISYDFKMPSRFRIYHGLASQNKKNKNIYQVVIMMNHNEYSLLSTLAHEMIHIKQMTSGDLMIDHEQNKRYWKGVDHTYTKYEDQPWEIEAFKNESRLTKNFLKYKKNKLGIFMLYLDKIILSI